MTRSSRYEFPIGYCKSEFTKKPVCDNVPIQAKCRQKFSTNGLNVTVRYSSCTRWHKWSEKSNV